MASPAPRRRGSRAAARARALPRAGVVVRVAGAQDVATVVALRLQLLRDEARSPLFRRVRRDAEAKARAFTEAQLASDDERTLLAWDGDAAVGLLRCSVSRGRRLVHPARYAFLSSAYVRPSHRGRGVLRALLTEAEAWCRARGLSEVRLHCALENDGANGAWEALGYRAAMLVRRRVLAGGAP